MGSGARTKEEELTAVCIGGCALLVAVDRLGLFFCAGGTWGVCNFLYSVILGQLFYRSTDLETWQKSVFNGGFGRVVFCTQIFRVGKYVEFITSGWISDHGGGLFDKI